MTLIESISDRIDGFSKIEGIPFQFQEASRLLTEILECKDALERISQETMASGTKTVIGRLNELLLKSAGSLNRTISRMSGGHVANYLGRLEMIHEYVKIDSVIQSLEERPFLKIHPRTLAILKELDDAPYTLVDTAGSIMELRLECNKIALQINEEIDSITSNLRDTLTRLKELIAQ
jgi:hypothetical protein